MPIYANDMAISRNGDIFITSSNSIITELSPALRIIHTYYLTAHYFDGAIAISRNGDIWVANNTYKKHFAILKLNPRGKIIGIYHLKGYWPQNVAIDHSGNIWVGSSWSKNQVSFISTLTELNRYGYMIAKYKLKSGNPIENILVDNYGNILVLTNTILLKLNPKGKIINKYSVQNNILGMTIDSSGNIWVTNYMRGTVTEYIGIDKK
ncbi:MAG: NHL repeat-containing protein [bacterium]